MQVQKDGERWIALSTYAEREIPKRAGFRWDPMRKHWFTLSESVAERITNPEKHQAQVALSRATGLTDSSINIPVPEGLSYLPYQRAGIEFALNHQSVLFGDEMGLGKTVQVCGAINADASLKSILIVCPASLKLNWRNELKRWLTRELQIGIAAGDSLPTTDIVIINYDIVERHHSALLVRDWDLLVCDEAHYMKNQRAKRTIAIVGNEKTRKPGLAARRRMLLTGTPIPNRPIEAFPLVNFLDPGTFPNFFGYAKRYCAAHRNGYGWDFSGASHLDELQDKLRASIMVRRLKRDVLTELPAKRRTVIELPTNGARSAVEAEREAYERTESQIEALSAQVELSKAESPSAYADAVQRMRDAVRAAFTEISHLRHQTAVAKIPTAIEHIENAIEDGSKVVVFAHHHDVIKALAKHFDGKAVTVYGETAVAARQEAVERFQTDPTCQLFLGSIMAAGVGLTLTAASHVVFVELDWVPGNVTQAEDRCHRIGQREMVLVEHLVLADSLDARMAKTLVAKQEVIDQALDREHQDEPIAPVAEHVSATQKEIEQKAALISADAVLAAHEAMRLLAGLDSDHAYFKNDMGFNGVDTRIGHSLAERGSLTPKQAVLAVKLARKYHRQLPEELLGRLAR